MIMKIENYLHFHSFDKKRRILNQSSGMKTINTHPILSIHPFNFPFRLLTDYGKYGAIHISVGMDIFMIGNKLR